MIPKISAGSSYIGLLNYLEDKPNKLKESGEGLKVITGSQRIDAGNFDTTSLTEIESVCDKSFLATAFAEWDEKNKSTRFENKVAHFSLSFAHQDTIDQQKTIAIAQEFLKMMGYEHIPFVVYQHNDKAHNHIHICTSRVGVNSKKVKNHNDVQTAIKICRELEVKYGLTKVEKRDPKINNLNSISTETQNASKDLPFRDTILKNLQYYLNKERITNLPELFKKLLFHNIEMKTEDKDGNRLARNGVRFYLKEKDKIVSYLSGKNIEKNFSSKIEQRLQDNKENKVFVAEKEAFIPTLKPSFQIQKDIGEAIFNVFDLCSGAVLVNQKNIIELLKPSNIIPEFSLDKEGNLKGLSFVFKNARYRSSDFLFKGIKLSAQVLAPYFAETLTKEKVIQSAIKSTRQFIELTGGKLLSKKVLIEVLNRNHILLTEKVDGSAALIINHLGKRLSVDLSKYEGGYVEFLKAAGWNCYDELTPKMQDKIKMPATLATPLNIHEKFIYNTILKGNLKEIQEVSKLETQITLTDGENEKMYHSLQTMNYYNATQNKMSRAASSLKYADKKTGKKHSLFDVIAALNLRGVAVIPIYNEPTTAGGEKELKNIHFRPIIDKKSGNPPLNFFQTIAAFDSKTLKALYENPNPKDLELLSTDPIVEGVYFSFEPEVTEIILAAETEPSLMDDYKDKLLENYPELEQEVDYIESLEKSTGRGEPTYPEYNSHAISSIFRDYGTMPINRGVDGEAFKKLHRKFSKYTKGRSV